MKQIIAMGGGGFLMDDTPLLDDFILSCASGSAPRVCFVATASGDSDRMLVNYYTALGPRCRATHLPLFRRQHADVAALCTSSTARCPRSSLHARTLACTGSSAAATATCTRSRCQRAISVLLVLDDLECAPG
jgi:hypothetical protein